MPEAHLELSLEDNKGNISCLAASSQFMLKPGPTNLQPQLYIGTDPSVNELTLTVALTGAAGSTLRGSACAAKSPDPAAASILVIPDPQLIDTRGVARVKPNSPSGWCCWPDEDSFSGSPGWRFTPEKDIVLTSPLKLQVTFGEILANEQNTYSGTLAVTTSHFPAGTEMALQFAVDLAYPPKDDDQPLNIAVDWITQEFDGQAIPDGEVIISNPGFLIDNELIFSLTNSATTDASEQKPLVPPQKVWSDEGKDAPTFFINFLYAQDTPGNGALSTTAFAAKNAPVLEVIGDDHHKWILSKPLAAKKGPFWTLKPRYAGNQAILGTGIDATVSLRFSGVRSDCLLGGSNEFDLTLMYITWKNIPGYLPGGTFLKITKVDTLMISQLTSQPSHGQDINSGDEVILSWTTRGAEQYYLTGAANSPYYQYVAGDGYHQLPVNPTPGFNEYEVFAVRQGKKDLSTGSITFKHLLWRLAFNSFDIIPSGAVTKRNQFTEEIVAVLPGENVGIGKVGNEIYLAWEINHPEFVDHYELYIGHDEEHVITIREFDSSKKNIKYKIIAEQVTRNGLTADTEFSLKAIPKYGEFEDHGALAKKTIFIRPPLEGSRPDGIFLDAAAVAPTIGLVVNKSQLVLANGPNPCACSYHIHLNPDLATNWFLGPISDGDDSELEMTHREDPYSYTMTLQPPFDTIPCVKVRGLAGDLAAVPADLRVISIDRYLENLTFTTHVENNYEVDRANSGRAYLLDLEISFGPNLQYRSTTTLKGSDRYEYYHSDADREDGFISGTASLQKSDLIIQIRMPELTLFRKWDPVATMAARLTLTEEGNLSMKIRSRFWEVLTIPLVQIAGSS